MLGIDVDSELCHSINLYKLQTRILPDAADAAVATVFRCLSTVEPQ